MVAQVYLEGEFGLFWKSVICLGYGKNILFFYHFGRYAHPHMLVMGNCMIQTAPFSKITERSLLEMKIVITKEIVDKNLRISEHVSIDMPWKMLHFS